MPTVKAPTSSEVAVGSRISVSEPSLGEREQACVRECFETNLVSSVGPFVERFERQLARQVGARHAVATVNGTAALHLALLVAGVEPGDEVLVPALSFIACANAVRYASGSPVFIDAEPVHWQMDPDAVERYLLEACAVRDGAAYNRRTGRRVRAVMPVDVLGHPCDMDPLVAVAHQYGLVVIEDATESLGATYKGRPTGNLGDVGCFSFNGNKIITTGGGGMLVTDHEPWARRAKYLSTQAKDDPVEYVHGSVGYNYRLPNLLAAMGCAQLERLEHHVTKRRRIAQTYAEKLSDVPGLRMMPEAPWVRSNWWLSTVLVDPELYGMSSRGLLTWLAARSIESRPLWRPLHRNPPYAGSDASCPVADRLYAEALSLPSSAGLSSSDQDRVIQALRMAAGGGRGAA